MPIVVDVQINVHSLRFQKVCYNMNFLKPTTCNIPFE